MMRDLGTLMICKPRASGDDPQPRTGAKDKGDVNPARAGMIRENAHSFGAGDGKPRASGDDPPSISP